MGRALCQNGLPVRFKEECEYFSAGGRTWQLAKGDVAYIFKVFIERYAREVEPISGGVLDDWSWNVRNVRDSDTDISNHAGYAVDINSLDHMRGVRNTFSHAQLAALRNLLNEFWVLRWGGDYKGTVDDMHFEINQPIETVHEFARQLRARTPVGPDGALDLPAIVPVTSAAPTRPFLQDVNVAKAPAFPLPRGYYFGPKEGPKNSVSGYFSHSDDLKRWQQRMSDRAWDIASDGKYGDETRAVIIRFQQEKRLVVDGKIGPSTWRAAWEAPIT